MTLNIFSPTGPGPVGPGIRSFTQWIPEYTVPAGSHWEFLTIAFLGPPERIDMRHTFPDVTTETGIPSFLLGDPAAGQLTFPTNGNVHARQGDDADYVIRLVTPAALVLDEARVTLTWDASWAFKLPVNTGTGGFTQTDREDLVLVKGAVYSNLGGVLASGLQPILSAIDLVRGPPRSSLRPGSTQLLSGRGVLEPLIDASGARAFGGTWSWFTVPEGFGFADGQLVEYFNRMAQFVVLREGSDDTLYIDELSDSNAEGGFFLWKLPAPTQVRYDIAPGVTVAWRWLI
jgi:hypothetical protein